MGEGETDEDSAAFVMKNLDFDDDSIVDTKYVIPGGEQTVTVSNGQYLELFAATATPRGPGVRATTCVDASALDPVGGDLGRPFQPERFFLMMRGDRGRPLRRLTGRKGFL